MAFSEKVKKINYGEKIDDLATANVTEFEGLAKAIDENYMENEFAADYDRFQQMGKDKQGLAFAVSVDGTEDLLNTSGIDAPNDPRWIQPFILPFKFWINNDQKKYGLQAQINFWRMMAKQQGLINSYFFDIDKLGNAHKPFWPVIKKTMIEPPQKFWVEYALKKGIISEDGEGINGIPAGYNPDALNPAMWFAPTTIMRSLKKM